MIDTATIDRNRGTPAAAGHAIEELAAALRGPLIRPGDAAYDEARRVWNGMIDKYPALIARCVDAADVATAVRFARRTGLPLAVRGGGHNVAGHAVCDGGLVIDCSLMTEVQVDPGKRTAAVQSGATWGDVDRATQRYGLVTPGGEVSTTGVAGFTLSGGMGMLQRQWGLACDNLLAVEIVTADGGIHHASAIEHPDLFWAVRGGGGNFGVVTRFEYQLYPLGPEVFSASTLYPFADAAAVVRGWRALADDSPDAITSQALLWSVPAIPDFPEELHHQPVAGIIACFAGDAEEGERALQPFRELSTPILDMSGRVTYVEMQRSFDPFVPAGRRYYWKSLYLDALDDALLDVFVATGAARPNPDSVLVLRQLGGAIGQLPDDASAYGHRRARYNLSLDSIWDDPDDDEHIVAWTRQTWADLRDRTGGGVYLNFAGLGEDNDVLARAGYGRNYDRLREIKRRYDPANLFRGNVNIAP